MKSTHLITLGGLSLDESQISFECTNGPKVIKRLEIDFIRSGGRLLSCDELGFTGIINKNQHITYTMIEI